MGHYMQYKIDDFTEPVSRSHHYRYYCGRGYCEPEDIVLDCGCGLGTGTELLSRVAKKVIGIDRDPEAILYASNTHKLENNYFMVGNLDQLDKLPECDVIICTEVLEHLRYPETFAAKAMIAARKKIFITTPVIPTKHEDSTHLHDFTETQVIEMFTGEGWVNIDSSRQGPYLLVSFARLHGQMGIHN